ncbi:hypothetical protein ACIBF1_34195 [Spirillospora sp. NPDC050679]
MKRSLAALAALGLVLGTAPAAHADAPRPWHDVKLPFLWPSAELHTLAAGGPDNVWIGGLQGKYCVPNGRPFECLVRSDGNPVVRRWNGEKWVEYPLNGLADGTGAVHDIAVAKGEVWIAAGGGYVGRFNGSSFQKVPSPEGAGVLGFYGSAAGLWASLGWGKLYRWNGSAWTKEVFPGGDGAVPPLEGRGPSEAWTLWKNGEGDSGLMRWDGATWRKVTELPVGGEFNSAYDFTVSGNGDVYSIDAAPGGQGKPNAVHRYRAGAWSQVAVPAGYQVRDLVTDGKGVTWGYGSGPDGNGALLRRDGDAWTVTPVPADFSLDEPVPVPGTDILWGLAMKYSKQVRSNF